MPGGKLERGEQPPEVVERELAEKLGLRVRSGTILDSWLREVLLGREVLIVTYSAEASLFDGLQRSDEHQAEGRFTAAEVERLPTAERYRASVWRALAGTRHPT